MSEYIAIDRGCYHCGDKVADTPYLLDNHAFCCLGCQTVYQVLHDNNMGTYYKYNTHPGKSQKKIQADLSYLDEPVIVNKLVDYKDDERTIITFYIPAIHCSSCIWLLEHLYKLHKGVVTSQVDFMKKQASVTFKHGSISLRALVELLDHIGYEPKITLQDVVKEAKKVNQNGLIAKIAVAGFCFGNSMMLSFPEYFGIDEFERQYSHYFGYLNLAFGIPVFFYSASGYFKSAWYSLKQHRLNLDVPLALGILVLFLRTAYEVLTHTGPGFADTLCSLVFFILIGKWIQERTYHHISFERDYRSYFPVAVTVINGRGEKPIQLADLQVGDRILVRNNEIIPADSILLKGEASVDFSFVTGESKIVHKELGEIIYAGGRQMGEAMELEVVKPVSQSYLTKLWNNESVNAKEKDYKTFVGFISKYFTVILVLISVTAWVFWWISGDMYKAWASLTAALIIACPCALALSSPFTLSAALSILDKNKFYVKSAAAIEQMASVDCLVFDKTGTISSPKSSAIRMEGELNGMEKKIITSICRQSSHPLSREIVKYLGIVAYLDVTHFEEIVGGGLRARYAEYDVSIGSAKFVGTQQVADGSAVFVKINGAVKCSLYIEQSWRPGLSGVVEQLKSVYELHLVSGDNERHADALRLIFPHASNMAFNQGPSDKLDKIAQWQGQGRRVAMLGDGLNDAGALAKADMGIAVSDDINNFSPGCDAILDGDSFDKLPRFFRFSKDAGRVIRMSFVISVLYNIVGLSIAVQGVMSPLFAAILMPLSTVTIISFTSLTTRWFAKRRGLV